MLTHLSEPTNLKTNLLKKSNYYECPECLIHFAAAPSFCWFCGIQFQNYMDFDEVFPREEQQS